MSKKIAASKKRRVFVDCGYTIDGKRIRPSKTCESKEEEDRFRATTTLDSGNVDMSDYNITFGSLAKRYIEYKESQNVSEATMAKWERHLRIVEDDYSRLHGKVARKILMIDIGDVLSGLAAKYSKSYISDIKSTISAVLNFGIDNGLLVRNVCTRARVSKKIAVKPRYEKKNWTPEQLATIEKYYPLVDFGDVVYLLLNTGVRAQECVAIDERAVYVQDNKTRIKIEDAMKRTKSGKWKRGTTKTDSSVRDNPISKAVYFIAMKRIMANKEHLFLPGKSGKEMSYNCFRDHYVKFFAGLNEQLELMGEKPVPYLPPHCCRHTFASRLRWQGVSEAVIADLLGHADEETTHIYTHSADMEKVAAMAKIS